MSNSLSLRDGKANCVESLTKSELLRRKIRLVSPCTNENSPSLLTHPRLREFYPELLFILHCTSRASVPLMEAALRCSRDRSPADAVAAGLAEYLERHIPEELYHDEWMLEDMEVLGIDRVEVLKRIPPAPLAAAVGSQYYWIYHYHPVAFLGYVAVLEGDPTPKNIVEAAVVRSGLPREAFRSLLVHSDNDPNHRDDFNQTLDRLPLRPEHTTVISVSAFQVACTIEEVFAQMLARFVG